jgi:hypothetical protein
MKPCPQKTGGALRRGRRGRWALAACGLWPRSWGARGARSRGGLPRSRRCPRTLRSDRCVAPVPVETKRPARLAPCTKCEGGSGNTDGRRSRRHTNRVPRSGSDPPCPPPGHPGNAGMCRGAAAREGGTRPAVTHDGARPRRRSRAGARDAVRADGGPQRGLGTRWEALCVDGHHSASASGQAVSGRARAPSAGLACLRSGLSQRGRWRAAPARS